MIFYWKVNKIYAGFQSLEQKINWFIFSLQSENVFGKWIYSSEQTGFSVKAQTKWRRVNSSVCCTQNILSLTKSVWKNEMAYSWDKAIHRKDRKLCKTSVMLKSMCNWIHFSGFKNSIALNSARKHPNLLCGKFLDTVLKATKTINLQTSMINDKRIKKWHSKLRVLKNLQDTTMKILSVIMFRQVQCNVRVSR